MTQTSEALDFREVLAVADEIQGLIERAQASKDLRLPALGLRLRYLASAEREAGGLFIDAVTNRRELERRPARSRSSGDQRR